MGRDIYREKIQERKSEEVIRTGNVYLGVQQYVHLNVFQERSTALSGHAHSMVHHIPKQKIYNAK